MGAAAAQPVLDAVYRAGASELGGCLYLQSPAGTSGIDISVWAGLQGQHYIIRQSVRPALPNDAEALYRLQAHTSPLTQRSILSRADIMQLLDDGPGLQYVADVGGRVVAACLQQHVEAGPHGSAAQQLALAAVHPALEQGAEIASIFG